MNTEITAPLFAAFRGVIGPQRHLLVGLSGGLDSSVLLHSLVQWRQTECPELQLRAVYIHHGLNTLADDWAAHCARLCDALDVDFRVCRVTVNAHKKGIEAGAREARYQAFLQTLNPGEALVTAQHLNDQCETFFLALKRGSGPAGLSAMPEQMLLDGMPLLRPLLSFSRPLLETYAQAYQMTWVEDDSNADVRYDRNFFRHEIMPPLTARWPHFAQAVSRSAALCGEQEALLDELLQPELNQLIDDDGVLTLAPLLDASAAKRNAILRRWLARCAVQMPSQLQINLLWQEVALAKPDAEPCYVLKPHSVRRYQGKLYVVASADSLADHHLPWDLQAPLVLPDGAGVLSAVQDTADNLRDTDTVIRAPRPGEQVTVRFGLQGHYHITGRDRGRTAKKLWQEAGIAPWLRGRTPLIWFNDTLMAAAGVFVTRDGEAEEAGCRVVIRRENNNSA